MNLVVTFFRYTDGNCSKQDRMKLSIYPVLLWSESQVFCAQTFHIFKWILPFPNTVNQALHLFSLDSDHFWFLTSLTVNIPPPILQVLSNKIQSLSFSTLSQSSHNSHIRITRCYKTYSISRYLLWKFWFGSKLNIWMIFLASVPGNP